MNKKPSGAKLSKREQLRAERIAREEAQRSACG